MGVGGTAMTAIAGMFKESGCEVRGSDSGIPYPPMSDLIDRLDIPVMHPYAPENLSWGPDLVVVGNVIREANPEASALLASDIMYTSMPTALREYFLLGHRPIVVAGTHGKTTTATLLAHLLARQDMDPGFMVGGISVDFMNNYRLGNGDFFVVEGDEYDTAFFDKGPKFLHYSPMATIINNVEFDHADIFDDLDHVISSFSLLSDILPPGSPLIVPENDANCAKAIGATRAEVTTFGLSSGTWRPVDIRYGDGGVTFNLIRGEESLGEFHSPMIGDHNLLNTVAALSLLHEAGAVTSDLADALACFRGVRKRQEIRGIEDGVVVIDDFAHHPTAVRETIRAVRSGYPGTKLIALFEPESNTSRRAVFQEDFSSAFALADAVFFTTPLEKPDGLEPEERLDMERLCLDISANGVPATMISDVSELAGAAAGNSRPGDVILCMSGRDFHGIHDLIIGELRKRATIVNR